MRERKKCTSERILIVIKHRKTGVIGLPGYSDLVSPNTADAFSNKCVDNECRTFHQRRYTVRCSVLEGDANGNEIKKNSIKTEKVLKNTRLG